MEEDTSHITFEPTVLGKVLEHIHGCEDVSLTVAPGELRVKSGEKSSKTKVGR